MVEGDFLNVMLVRQGKNTFIRSYFGKGYISNQLTRFDRIYNETGADFLNEISRIPQNVDDILDRLQALYGDSVTREALRVEFISFIDELVKTKFLVVGETEEELDSKDLDFSYAMENPKTMVNDFTQRSNEVLDENTQNMMLEATHRKPRLNGIQFELTSRCNERCIHCYIPNAKKNNGGDMPLDKVKSIIDEFANNGGLQVTLSGGEVFLHKDIIPIIKYCREKDLMITILSNLVALRDYQIPFLKEYNVSCVQVSLYSMEASVHDLITTVKGSFEKTKAAIEKLVNADVPIVISCPMMKANYKGYKEVLKYAQSIKCKVNVDVIMMAQADLDTNNLANRLSVEESGEVISDIIENNADYRKAISELASFSSLMYANYDNFVKLPLCGAGINDCCIAENGDVYPCAGWQDMVVGNVYQQSLKDIWDNSDKLKNIRAVTQGDFPQCLECEAQDYCSRCLVRNYNESDGDMFKLNKHFCDVAFLNKKIVEDYFARNKQ